MKIRALIEDADNVPAWLQWRITNPFKQLKRHGIDVAHMWVTVGDKIDEDIDILIIPRLVVGIDSQEAVQTWFESIKSNGTKLVYEADDDIWSESYVSQLSKVYWKPNEPIERLIPILDELEARRKAALWTLQQCDAVTVSTKSLGIYVQTLVDIPVYVIQNAIDRKRFEKGLKPKEDSEIVSIGWAGGRRSENDLDEMIEAWIKVAEHGHKVKFVIGGWLPPAIEQSKILQSKLYHIQWLPTDEYASSLQVDIGCCSVSNNPFALRKSPIKAWEYALAGASIVASIYVYNEEPILLTCDNTQDWIDFLEFNIKNKDFRIAQANAYKQHVIQQHDLRYQYIYWLNTYEEILNGNKKVAVS